jgi:hypothetical protein
MINLLSGQSKIKCSNPPPSPSCKCIVPYCSQPLQTQAASESKAELLDFPPIREGNSAPLFASIQWAAWKALQPPPVFCGKAPPLSQWHRQPSVGLGQSNILNTASETALVRHVSTMANPKVRQLTSTVLGRLCSSALRCATQ